MEHKGSTGIPIVFLCLTLVKQNCNEPCLGQVKMPTKKINQVKMTVGVHTGTAEP